MSVQSQKLFKLFVRLGRCITDTTFTGEVDSFPKNVDF